MKNKYNSNKPCGYKTPFFNLFVTNNIAKYARVINNGKFVVIVTKKNGNAVNRFKIKRKIYNAIMKLNCTIPSDFMYTVVAFSRSLDIYQNELENQISLAIQRIKLPSC